MKHGNKKLIEDDRWKMKGGFHPKGKRRPPPCICPKCKGQAGLEDGSTCPVCKGEGYIE